MKKIIMAAVLALSALALTGSHRLRARHCTSGLCRREG